MFSYEFYKVIHLFCIIIFACGIGFCFAQARPSKNTQITMGVVGVLILVAGTGMMARLGIGHGGDSWPGWLVAKIVLWLALVVLTPILSKRVRGSARDKALYALIIGFGLAVLLGVYRPF